MPFIEKQEIRKPVVSFLGMQPYPLKAQQNNRSGRAVIRVNIRKDGSCEYQRTTSEDPEGFDFARMAIQYLEGSTWQPALRDGVPFDSWLELTFVFHMGKKLMDQPVLPGDDQVFHIYEGDTIVEPQPVNPVEPVYPQAARAAKQNGKVSLMLVIDTKGVVEDAVVLKETNPGYGFGDAALEAVRQWRFTPPILNGEAVRVKICTSVEFKLTFNRI